MAKFLVLVAILVIALALKDVLRDDPTPAKAAVTTPAPPKTPEQAAAEQQEMAASMRARLGLKALKDAARNPDSFKLVSARIIEKSYAVCYEYRAQNGFGGMNRGRAVLAADGKFLNDGMDGFTKAWNAQCTRPGYDIGRVID